MLLVLVAVVLGVMLASCIPIFGPPVDTQTNVFSNISNGLGQ